MKISMRKLSELTGYSSATISNALNYKPNVSLDVANKIREIAKQYGYEEDTKISKIRFILYKKSGVVVSDTPFFTELVAGIEKESKLSGYPLVITYLDKYGVDFESELQDILSEKNVGNILLATEMTEEDLLPFTNTAGLLVVVDAWFPSLKLNTIQINNQDAVYEATEYLVKNGHKDIGYIKSSFPIQNFKERYIGYTQALISNGISVDTQIAFSLTPNMISAYNEFKDVINSGIKLPKALIADNDIIALGCLRALNEAGIKVPSDVSIIGFDDLPFAEICTPPLTTIKVPIGDLGCYAVRRLHEIAVKKDKTSLRNMLSCELIERESVRKNIDKEV